MNDCFYGTLQKKQSQEITKLSHKKFQIRRKMQLKLLINKKTGKKLQQTIALIFSSSILTVTGKSDFQFSTFYNISRALEPNIPGSKHATII